MGEVARRYGFDPNRAGFIRCPFHRGDNSPSLKIYPGKGGWHCFGCNAGGSVIDFTMRLFDINFQQAILRLDMDFRLNLGVGRKLTRAERSAVQEARRRETEARRRETEARRREAEEKAAREREYQEKAAEHRHWLEIAEKYAPGPGVPVPGGESEDAGESDDLFHPLYVEAVSKLAHLEYWLDEHLSVPARKE